MKKYVVIAGVNGAGKSTLYQMYEEFKDIKECDLVALYDNSEKFRRFAIYKSGNIVRLSRNVPTWFLKIDV